MAGVRSHPGNAPETAPTTAPATVPTAEPIGQDAAGSSGDPAERLLELSLGHLYAAALHTAARLGIADLLAGGPRTADELAAAADAHGPHLRRMLRLLATKEVFREDEAGRFHLTPLAQPLRTGAERSLRDYVAVRGEEVFWRSAARLHTAVRTGSTAFEDVYGVPFYDYLAVEPALESRFHAGMASFSEALSNDVAETCDFSGVANVVDVGGGRGGLLRAVLRRHPHMTGLLFDLETVVSGHLLDEPELADRWCVDSGDFFVSVPAGADGYLLKHVLASWPDEECVRILRTVRRAMPAHGRLYVVNALIPPGNAPHPGKLIDMVMLTVLNGRGRSREEYRELLEAAGFSVERVAQASPHASVVEAVPVS